MNDSLPEGRDLAVPAGTAGGMGGSVRCRVEMLARTLSTLTASPNPEAFLGQVLSLMIESFDAQGATLWLDDPAFQEALNIRRIAHFPARPNGPALAVRRGVRPADEPILVATRANAQNLRRGEVIRHDALAIAANEEYCDHRAFLSDTRTRHIVYVPLLLGMSYRGFITMRFSGDDGLHAGDEPLAVAFGTQAVLALELSRAAVRARDEAAVTEGRQIAEAKVSDLMRVNAALRDALSGLQHFEGLATFLCNTLVAATSIFSASGATLFLVDGTRRRLSVACGVRGGELVDVGTDPDYAHWQAHSDVDTADDLHYWDEVFGDPVLSWIDPQAAGTSSIVRRLSERRACHSVVFVPLWRNAQPFGVLGVGFVGPGRPTQAEMELVTVVAQQITLAYEFTRLGDEQREAALARERQAAAEAQVAELSRMNAIFMKALHDLRRFDDLHDFTCQTLDAAMDIVGSFDAGLFFVRGSKCGLPQRSVYANGVMVDVTNEPVISSYNVVEWGGVPADASHWDNLLLSDGLWWTSMDDPVVPSELRTYHQGQGRAAIARIPFWQNTILMGYVGLGFSTTERPQQSKLEMVRVLVEQLMAAIELRRLWNEDRNAVIAQERQQAATQRVFQLEQANAALARSTAELSAQNGLDAYLGSVMATFLEHLPSSCASLWLFEDGRAGGYRRLAVRTGARGARPFAAADLGQDHVQAKQALLRLIEGDTPQHRRSHWKAEDVAVTPALDGHEDVRSGLRSAGIRSVLEMPVVAADRVFGSIFVCLSQAVRLDRGARRADPGAGEPGGARAGDAAPRRPGPADRHHRGAQPPRPGHPRHDGAGLPRHRGPPAVRTPEARCVRAGPNRHSPHRRRARCRDRDGA